MKPWISTAFSSFGITLTIFSAVCLSIGKSYFWWSGVAIGLISLWIGVTSDVEEEEVKKIYFTKPNQKLQAEVYKK